MTVFAALFLAAFGVFAGTAAPTVSYDDTGEFCVAAMELGVPHPPGYPLYTLLMSLWRHLPVASLAGRLNLLAAACAAAAACACLSWLRRDRTAWPAAWGWPCAGFALLAVLVPGMWSQSGTAKGGVYALNAALVLSAASAWSGPALSPRAAMVAALASGLALANHWMTALGLVPALLVMLLPAESDRAAGRRAALALCAVALGISLVLYLPLAACGKPFLDWGEPNRLDRLLFVLGRAQYTGVLAGETRLPFGERLAQLRGTLAVAGPAAVAGLLAVLGAVAALRRAPWPAAAALIYLGTLDASLLVYGPLRAGAPWYLDIFAVPATLVLLGFAARGAGELLRLVPARFAAAAAGLPLLLCALWVLPARREVWDRSREYSTWDMALNLDRMTARPGLLLASSDAVIFGNWHLRLVEQRPGGLFAVPAPLLPMPWVANSMARTIPRLRAPYPAPRVGAEAVPALMRAWVEGNERAFDLYTFLTDASRAAFPRERLEPQGWVYRIRPAGKRPGDAGATGRPRWRSIRARGWTDGEIAREPRLLASIQPIAFSGVLTMAGGGGAAADARAGLRAARSLARGAHDEAVVWLTEGNLAAAAKRMPEAIAAYTAASRLAAPHPIALRNLTMLYLSLGRRREAVATLKTLLREAPDSEEAAELRPMLRGLEPGRAPGS